MDRVSLDSKSQKIVNQRNVFLFFSVVLSVAVVMLSCLIFFKNERLVVVPTTGSALWVEDTKVSDTYLERFGSYMADLLLTRTPADVDRKNKIILEYVHPSFYHEAQKQLQQDRDSIVKSDQSLLFRPARSFIDPLRQTYVVEGELLIFVGKTGEKLSCAQTDRKKFSFEFQCQGGKLLLKSLKMENL